MRRVVQISAGRGPVEVQRFVDALGPALAGLLAARGLTVVDHERGRGSVRLVVDGDGAIDDLLGTHALIDPSRGRGARRRWFAGVSARTELGTVAPIDARDVRFTAARAGGPGGQHVNTTSSAVRAVHLPTGLAVRASGQRSQHANRTDALRRLAEALHERALAARAGVDASDRAAHDAVVRGAPVVSWVRAGGVLRPVDAGRAGRAPETAHGLYSSGGPHAR